MSERDEGLSRAPDGRPAAYQPAWRRDFPVDTAQEQYVVRRDFTRFMVLTSLAFAAGQLWIGIHNWFRRRRGRPGARAIAALDRIPVGGTLTFHYPDANDVCLLARPDESTLLAYSQKCTHLGCAVLPAPGGKQLDCPCHKAHFDLATGRPLTGPPRRPLPRIVLENRGGMIYATGVEVATV